MPEAVSFGQAISVARKKKEISQKQLSSLIKRDDGKSISPQYLNDIEHDRRNPTSDSLVLQFAKVLQIEPDYLFYLAGRLPTDIHEKNLSPDKVKDLMVAFRKEIKGNRKK